jgi:hypothetical protein
LSRTRKGLLTLPGFFIAGSKPPLPGGRILIAGVTQNWPFLNHAENSQFSSQFCSAMSALRRLVARSVRIMTLASRRRPRLRLPTRQRLFGEPDRQASAISQGCIIFAPVRNSMTLAGNVASAFRMKLTWGGSGQGVDSVAHNRTPAAVSVSKVRAHCTIWSLPRQIKLTFGRRSLWLHQYPAYGGQGSGRRDHSLERRFKPCVEAVRPPGSARTDQVLEDLRIC